MDQQDNTQLVQQAYRHFLEGDIPALLNLCADDIEWELAEVENVPFSGKRKGKEQVAQFFSMVNELQQPLQFEPREFVAQGDKVVALGHYTWNVKSTDRKFDSDFAEVFTFRGGKIAAFKDYADSAAEANAYKKS